MPPFAGSDALVLFGAPGDLARKKLSFALDHMTAAGNRIPVVGVVDTLTARLSLVSEEGTFARLREELDRLGSTSIPASAVTAADQVLFCDARVVGDNDGPRVATEGN